MNNLDFYNALRKVPDTAKKEIKGGRLNGKTDINPVWRIKALTEQFGPCGVGWKYAITEKRLERGVGEEIAAFVDIDLFYKANGEWSDAIPGTGGSTFIAKEGQGLHTSDECFKMALTDALSVACKALGVGADVYWEKDTDKYAKPEPVKEEPKKPDEKAKLIAHITRKVYPHATKEGLGEPNGYCYEIYSLALQAAQVRSLKELNAEQLRVICGQMDQAG